MTMSENETILEEEIENLSIKAHKNDAQDKGLIIILDGAIDTYNAQLLENILSKLIKDRYINLTFLCSKLNYISSMGIGIFTNLLGTLCKMNGAFIFSEVQEKVYSVFNSLSFVKFFTFK